ncbi:hypothetical protein [Tardiphaga sp.]|uniref:hypothetical protein n=1 Tax=Tardiphaga sp. TaxID=1926292 RepID=UPI00262F40AF|nr:hypothetical protein [Tardiphaga sp.]MDB5615894.1 hypothetical protein [Tardiphaga sp.]
MDRAALAKECLEAIRLWPGCETVKEIGILANGPSDFLVRVIEYGAAVKRKADRAALCVQREKSRAYHLAP